MFDDLDLQWFAEDDDFDFGDSDAQAGYYDSDGNYLGDDDEAAQEAAESHDDDSFLTENWAESDDDFGEDDFDFSNTDAKAGYYDADGKYLGEDDAAAKAAAKSHDDDSFLTENWAESQNNFGYDVNDKGRTKINFHNMKKAAIESGNSVKGWAVNKADQANQFFGGARAGYTSADFERAKEAEKAWNTYDEKAKIAEKALNDFANKYDKTNKEDVDKYNELKAKYDDLIDRRDSISRDIHSTDTGNRFGNIGRNILEDLADYGTSINQFFGGADKYGLGSKGQINDRNGNGKVSFGERLLNMGRDTAAWAGKQVQNYGTNLLGTIISVENPIAGMIVEELANKGIDALISYAKTHPYNMTSAEKDKELVEYAKSHPFDLTNNEKARLAEIEAGKSDPTKINDMSIELADAGDDSDSSYDEPEELETNTPVKTVSISADKTPKVAKKSWTEMKLDALDNNKQSFGAWNRVNDTMGQKTLALSDAHFKDFVLAMMVDEPGMQNVIKTKLMLDYFK